MRVCVLTSSYPLKPGDMAGWFVRQQCQAMAEGEGVEVIVLAPGHPDAPACERDGRVEVRRLTYFRPKRLQQLAYGAGIMSNLRSRPVAWLNLVPFLLSLAGGAVRYGRRANLIHAHWGPIGALAVLMRRFHRRPVVLSVRGSDITGSSRLIRRITAWATGHADAVTANTPVSRRKAARHVRDKDLCRYVPNGVFLPDKQELETARAERTDGEFRLVSVGRLVPERRYDLLVAAIGRVRRTNPEVRLTIVGDGPEREALESLVAEHGLGERVTFTGQLPREEVGKHLARADTYVSTTERDNFANAVMEAGAYRLPVVATRVGFPAEAVLDGQTGFLVAQGDEDGLVQALTTLAQDPKRRVEFGRRMRDRIEQLGLTWAKCAARTVELYRAVLAKFATEDFRRE